MKNRNQPRVIKPKAQKVQDKPQTMVEETSQPQEQMQETVQETAQPEEQGPTPEKVHLSELEKEKLQELQGFKNQLDQLHTEIGRLKTEITLSESTLKEKEASAVNTILQIKQIEQNFIGTLQQKYGLFQKIENGEVIK